jgi:predicted CopG family antitoxin
MTKVISISDEAYDALKKIKSDRSFSEIIMEITREIRKEMFVSSIGGWGDKTAERVKKKINEERKFKSRRFG